MDRRGKDERGSVRAGEGKASAPVWHLPVGDGERRPVPPTQQSNSAAEE